MGLALLKGTAGEAAIDTIRSRVYEAVRFGPIVGPGLEGAYAFVEFFGNSVRSTIIFVERYQYEDARLFAAIWLMRYYIKTRISTQARKNLLTTASKL
jgi:hypothetical protein